MRMTLKKNTFKFLGTFLLGIVFFLAPIKIMGTWTILFDVVIRMIRTSIPSALSLYCMGIIVLAAILSVLAALQKRAAIQLKYDLSYFVTMPVLLVFRIVGAVFSILIYFSLGPEWLLSEGTGGLVFHTTIASVALIVPVGAIFITLFVAFGGLEYIGILTHSFMKPLFKVPGRSALDAVSSFVGSYTIGLYVTNKMYLQGRYSLREATIISTCFSTVSIGFYAVVASTLNLLQYFPLIFISSAVVSTILAIILVRIPPLSTIPDDYVGKPQIEQPLMTYSIWKQAYEAGLKQAAQSKAIHKELYSSFIDGLKLSMVILPPILSIGVLAIMIAKYTPIFIWIGKPMEPILTVLGLPDINIIAPATIIGITDMFLPALLVTEAAASAKFFIAVLSLSQVFFFSAMIPLLLEIDIPIQLKDILILFFLRTLMAIPLIALITHLVF